jgi:transposase
VLLRELRALGYPGGVSILKDHLATLKPVAQPELLIRFETEPGRQMQADLATIRRDKDRLAVFIATPGWSRATYVEFVADERMETLARLSRAGVLLLRRHPPRGALRQHADGGERAGSR